MGTNDKADPPGHRVRYLCAVEIQQALRESMDHLPEAITRSVEDGATAAWEQASQAILGNIKNIMAHLVKTQETLQETMSQIPDIIGQGVAEGVRPLQEADLPARLSELAGIVGQLGKLAQSLPEAVRDSLQGVNDILGEAVSNAVHQGLSRELGTLNEALKVHFQALTEVQRSQSNKLESMGDRITKQLEALGNTMGQSAAEGLMTAIEGTVTGHLKDINEAIGRLETTLTEAKAVVSSRPAPPRDPDQPVLPPPGPSKPDAQPKPPGIKETTSIPPEKPLTPGKGTWRDWLLRRNR